ncbi:hypothetical protein P700755_000093 [Psychroflexus torquis ATCC 700755]|uniref:Adhesin domain-containing protein n=1 Tax=Psychroflexus torquis (strain ATCC 700755 / CIP 106069 / ACAM 623) TaxID=313595 RepID=K4IDH7_PSYTT|nr:hypothetical protein [Psychroflexus torquis]AFU67166.1 hypothetical protein P700755_000093 [Psychroflexus torquis ATCC 700755]
MIAKVYTNCSLLVLLLLAPLFIFSQQKRVSTESFDVEKSPIVILDLSHSTVIIETWNKNRVEVKTTLTSDEENKEALNEAFDTSEIKVLGNSKRIEITSRKNRNAKRNGVWFFQTPVPPNPPRPPLPPKPPKPLIEIDFDYEAFKEEGRDYLEKFKEQLDSTNFRETMLVWRDELKNFRDDLKDIRNDQKDNRSFQDSLRQYARVIRENIKPWVEEFKEGYQEAKNGWMMKRSVKRLIEIKVPKSAKFEMNLRHSTMEVSSLHNVDANLSYSGLQLDTATGQNSKIVMSYSTLSINSAESLNLDIDYSKKVDLKKVDQLNVTSKMSELKIGSIQNQAIIKGTYGNLNIDRIDDDFSLIDIHLEKSSANLKLPTDKNFRFYAKSSNSKIEVNSELDFSMTKNFDDVIYTNPNSKKSSQIFNIIANYSNLKLN